MTTQAVDSIARITRGEATRARIIAIAREVLTNEGLEAFVIRDIAKRAGIQLGNLQYYFSTREDLIEAVIQGEFASNLETMRTLEAAAEDLADYMRRLAQLMLHEYTGVGGKLWPVLRLMRTHNSRFRELSKTIYAQHFESMVGAMRRFGVNVKDRELLHRARVITALVDGAALQAHLWSDAQTSTAFRALSHTTSEMAAAIAAA